MRRYIVTVIVLVAVAVSAGVALAVSSDDARPARNGASEATQPVAPVQAVQPQLKEHLGIFRERPGGGSDMIPAEALRVFARIGERVGANVQLARTVQTPDGPVHIVPGDGNVCFIAPGGMACGTSAYLSTEPQSYATISHSLANPRGTIRISGIAPDDVTEIAAIGADESTAIPVHDNAYSGLVPRDTDRLEFQTTSRGTVTALLRRDAN